MQRRQGAGPTSDPWPSVVGLSSLITCHVPGGPTWRFPTATRSPGPRRSPGPGAEGPCSHSLQMTQPREQRPTAVRGHLPACPVHGTGLPSPGGSRSHPDADPAPSPTRSLLPCFRQTPGSSRPRRVPPKQLQSPRHHPGKPASPGGSLQTLRRLHVASCDFSRTQHTRWRTVDLNLVRQTK